jgi:hypothetical protein
VDIVSLLGVVDHYNYAPWPICMANTDFLPHLYV